MKLLSRLKALWRLSGEIQKNEDSYALAQEYVKANKKPKQMAQVVSRIDPLADIIEK